jgi:hypothetical protein
LGWTLAHWVNFGQLGERWSLGGELWSMGWTLAHRVYFGPSGVLRPIGWTLASEVNFGTYERVNFGIGEYELWPLWVNFCIWGELWHLRVNFGIGDGVNFNPLCSSWT